MAKRKKKVEGLGDRVAKVTKALKIDKVVNFVKGKDCGCDERQAYLNTIGVEPINCFTEEQYKLWGCLKEQLKGSLKKYEKDIIIANFYELFGVDNKELCRDCSDSGKVFINMIDKINKVYNSYDSSR